MELSSLKQAITRYLQYLESEQGKSPLTIKNYSHQLNDFVNSCSVTTPLGITKETIRDYKHYLSQFRDSFRSPLSVRTKNHRLTVLRAFLKYLIQQEEMNCYPPERIQRLKEDPRQVKVLFEDSLESLLAAPDRQTPRGKRDFAILMTFFSTGLRLSELVSLNRRDINAQTREMSVRGKRGKLRVVFLSPDAIDAIQDYLEKIDRACDPLFVRLVKDTPGRTIRGEELRLNPRSIQNIMKKYVLLAEIVGDPSPHTLRHSFATNLLRNGADMRSVQEMLGHKDLSTTQIYTHVTNTQLKEVHDRFHGLR